MWLCLCSTLLLQGCFDIVEQLTLRRDGSGSFKLVLNLSRSRSKVQSILRMKTVNGRTVPSKAEIRQELTTLENILRSTPGISQVKSTLDFDNCISSIECRFSAVEQLNAAALKAAQQRQWQQKGLQQLYAFRPGAGLFTRKAPFSLEKNYRELSNADREVLTNAGYTGIFRFEQEVKSLSNAKSRLSADKKAVMLQQPLTDIITGKQTIDNTIQLTL